MDHYCDYCGVPLGEPCPASECVDPERQGEYDDVDEALLAEFDLDPEALADV